MTEKIAIIGAGNAGCISALNLHYLKETEDYDEYEIEIYHDPTAPIERVGQGTQINVLETIFDILDLDWVQKNSIKATTKHGIRYKGWGKENHDFFHLFRNGSIAMHYVPKLLSQQVLESGLFNVVEKTITNPENEIDATYIMDCRGGPDELDDSYDILTNPINSVILARKEGANPNLLWTEHIATPNGWVFVIPNHDSVSYGYLYNNTITTKEDAERDFVERFDVEPNDYLSFNNYVAKDIWRGEKTILNGNSYSFIEPLEAVASTVHQNISECLYGVLINDASREEMNESIYKELIQIQDFILWHYKNGSIYDTPFWNHAQSLQYTNNNGLIEHIQKCVELPNIINSDNLSDDFEYDWVPHSFKNWYNNVGSA